MLCLQVPKSWLKVVSSWLIDITSLGFRGKASRMWVIDIASAWIKYLSSSSIEYSGCLTVPGSKCRALLLTPYSLPFKLIYVAGVVTLKFYAGGGKCIYPALKAADDICINNYWSTVDQHWLWFKGDNYMLYYKKGKIKHLVCMNIANM